VTSMPSIDSISTLGTSIQEAAVTVTADTEREAHEAAWAWLSHHATKESLVISVGQREGVRNEDGTVTMRYF
jgi:hypothetical protein